MNFAATVVSEEEYFFTYPYKVGKIVNPTYPYGDFSQNNGKRNQ